MVGGAQKRNRKSLTSEVLVFVNTGQIAFASWAYHRAAPSELWGGDGSLFSQPKQFQYWQ